MPQIAIRNLNKSFGAIQIIKDISLDIKDQSFSVFVGPSGCGKSTLLRMIAGLENIDSGTISIDDQLVNELEPKERNVAMVFQSYALYPHMSVFENIAFGLKLEKRPKDEIEFRVHETAKILQMEEYLKRKPKQLSGGQRQRVAIGRAIIKKPKVFLFDEPLSNLDAALRVQMRVELAKLNQQLDATMIYVTHDQTEAMTMADEVIVLDNGRVSQAGEPMDLYNKPENVFVGSFIGSPKMNLIESKIISQNTKFTEVDLFGATTIKIPKISSRSNPGDEVTIGIRPEHLILNQNTPSNWVGRVFVVEKLGSSSFLYFEKEGEPLVVQSDGESDIKVGDSIKVGFQPERCHIFNSNGKSFY